MSWKVSDPMSEKLKLVVLFQSGQRSMTSICQELGISRKTGYKLLKRYEDEGLEGLKDRSRAPHHPARQIPGKIQDVVIQARRAHPTWGPRKLKAWVESRNPSLELPYPSTIGDILKREGLVHPRRHGRMKSVYGSTPRSDAKEPNQQWDADFKGEFRLGNGAYCFPLNVVSADGTVVFTHGAPTGGSPAAGSLPAHPTQSPSRRQLSWRAARRVPTEVD